MKKTHAFTLLLAVIIMVFGFLSYQESGAQTIQTQAVKKMNLTGKIAKSQHGYIIKSRKGNAPSEIFTILNAEPGKLDEFVKSEKTVSIEARLISGDNVEIEKIDGIKYGQSAQ